MFIPFSNTYKIINDNIFVKKLQMPLEEFKLSLFVDRYLDGLTIILYVYILINTKKVVIK